MPRCHLNKNDFSCRWNSPMSLSGWRILGGRLFQSCGPAAAKLQSLNCVLVRGTQQQHACRCRPIVAGVPGVRDEPTVIDKIRCRSIMKCLVDQEGQLEVDELLDRKPVQLPRHWSKTITSMSTGDESRCRVMDWSEAPEQSDYMPSNVTTIITHVTCSGNCRSPLLSLTFVEDENNNATQ